MGPAGDPSMTMGKLLSPATNSGLLGLVSRTVAAARANGSQARMTECNTVWNGGQSGVSDAFGSSLWAADLMFSLADSGMTGVNFHGGVGGNCYTPIYYSPKVSAKPEYYGILFFKYGAKGRFVRANLSDASANVGAYAMQCGSDSMRIAIINKDSLFDYSVMVNGVPYSGQGSLIRLIAPSLGAKTGLSFGGDSVTTTRQWTPTSFEAVTRPSISSGYAVTVPAVIVTIRK